MAFKTNILDEVTGPMVDRAQRRAEAAKDHLYQVIMSEVFSKSARDMIIEAAGAYANARQGIMEAKVGQEAADYVDRDFATFDSMTKAFSRNGGQ